MMDTMGAREQRVHISQACKQHVFQPKNTEKTDTRTHKKQTLEDQIREPLK